ncbi:hypothetical protein ID866_3998 [Astraeus odoratus]|nr:hypothetical protein ID866_3998 [Astraeus odoratus]
MQQAGFQPYHMQSKGTLVPGQTISVNKYTVQVEKYLSQGGFSHVYLVRTPTPVYNTTHHVLKRIAVANEAMLAHVKKEVDIMRILKGHPNVVYLIDAAWHRMSNGQYEVFILMEFCQGGGIIDMMNRRLRERLTEAEILQIFVDVCEGVAAMHNLRPPLLHRDLKVENILQSSSATYKLCDFGSATPVAPRPPATTQEIRALEADLNRHTTLQYRAPEMIDPYLRRPVDEKSDVWALGVLLYKLCYYTTPFEEHGPLAILNVQYRIPAYPVYSPQLNTLIGVCIPTVVAWTNLHSSVLASMLREHGTQRPTIFELLNEVHRMRGTKSRFVYHAPPPQPLSPRYFTTTPLDLSIPNRPKSSNTQAQSTPRKDVTPAAQARERVLDAIAPARRGRPPANNSKEPALVSASHPPSSPVALSPALVNITKGDLLAEEEDKAWKSLKSSFQGTGDVKAHKSGGVGWSAWKPKSIPSDGLGDEPSTSRVVEPGPQTPSAAFGDSFTEKLWQASDNPRMGVGASVPPPSKGKLTPSKLAPPPEGSRNTKLVLTKGKDAFDGLGLPTSNSEPPTLGEARKLRTGLAAIGNYHRPSVSPNLSSNPTKSSSPGFKPTPSPRSSLPYTSSSWGHSPSMQPTLLAIGRPPEPPQLPDSSVESRFPSLEELDTTFISSAGLASSGPRANLTLEKEKEVVSAEMPAISQPLLPKRLTPSSLLQRTARSEQVTGNATRDAGQPQPYSRSDNVDGASRPRRLSRSVLSPSTLPSQHSVSPTTHSPSVQQSAELLEIAGASVSSLLPRKTQGPQDWLTGDIDGQLSATKEQDVVDSNTPETPVLREFTKKRSSFIEENTVNIPSPQEVVTSQQSLPRAPTPPSPSKKFSHRMRSEESNLILGTLASECRDEPVALSSMLAARSVRTPNGLQTSATKIIRPLVDKVAESWQASSHEAAQEGKLSSSDEESPEDAVSMVPTKLIEKSSLRKRRGRQSSVHDLVDLWGGGVVQTKERTKDTTQDTTARDINKDVVLNLTKSRPSAVPQTTKHRASSPQRLLARSSEDGASLEAPRPPSRTSGRRSPALHTRQLSTLNSSVSPMAAPSHGRPQSLLLFPVSKSISDGKSDMSPTPGLSVPQDGSRKNGTRRTSITDMVQRYEAINASTKAVGHGPPSDHPKPTGLKLAPQVTSSATGSRSVPTAIGSPSVSRFNSLRPFENPSPSKDTERRPPSNVSAHSSMDVPGGLASIPKSSTTKPSSSSASSRFGPIDGLPVPSSPVPKMTVPSEDQRRSPSPEKPYQGVGKLIDQWQKKSEEAESARSPVPRRGYATKRAGLV